MSALWLPRTLTEQPQYPARILSSNGAPSFLIGTGTGLLDHANANIGSLAGGAIISPTPAIGGSGSSLILNGNTAYGAFASNNAYNITGAITLMWAGVITNYTNYNMLIARSLSNGATNNPFELRTNQTNGMINLTRSNASAFGIWSGSIAIPVNTPQIIFVTFGADLSNASQLSITVNGVLQSTTTVVSGPVGPATGNAEMMYLGRRSDGFYQTGSTILAAGWPRILSHAEIARFSANPWQLFKAPPRRLFIVNASHANNLIGTSIQDESASATISQSLPLIAASVQTQTASSAMNVGIPLTGQVAQIQSASGAINITIPLNGLAIQQQSGTGSILGSMQINLNGASLQNAISYASLSMSGKLLPDPQFTVNAHARSFPAKAPTENRIIGFDFTNNLPTGVTLIGTPTFTITVAFNGLDPNVTAMFIGSPQLVGNVAIQMCVAGIAYQSYIIEATCNASNSEILTQGAILPIKPAWNQ